MSEIAFGSGELIKIDFAVTPKGTIVDIGGDRGADVTSKSPRFKAALANAVNASGHAMAQDAADAVAYALTKYKITATGESAKHLVVAQTGTDKDGFEVWGLHDDGYPPLLFIRRGFKNKADPSVADLVEWAKAKGITVHDDAGAPTPEVQVVRGKTRTYLRAMRRGEKRDATVVALSKLNTAITRHGGSFRPGSNWRRYPPGKKGYFDYVSYVVERLGKGKWQRRIEKMGSAVSFMTAQYVMTGDRTFGSRTVAAPFYG